jgi:hypothetical protein
MRPMNRETGVREFLAGTPSLSAASLWIWWAPSRAL